MINNDVIHINGPSSRSSVIMDIPHAGRRYTDDFIPHCPLIYLRRVEDAYLDHLMAGIDLPVLSTTIARCVIDCNRSVRDIDDSMIAGGWNGDVVPQFTKNGIGLIMRYAGVNLPIYHRKLSTDQVQSRINHVYRPYHRALEQLIKCHHMPQKGLLHINLHSMPSNSAPADIVIGNRYGKTAGQYYMDMVEKLFSQAGFRVVINDQYAGAQIIKRHSDPVNGIHSIQVEINRALYLDEVTVTKSDNFRPIKNILQNIFLSLKDQMDNRLVETDSQPGIMAAAQ